MNLQNFRLHCVLPLLLALAACGGPEDLGASPEAPADAVGQSEAALTTTRVTAPGIVV